MEIVPSHKKEDEVIHETTVQNGILNNPTRNRAEIETQTSISSPLKRKHESYSDSTPILMKF
jgi:hypothetical protein